MQNEHTETYLSTSADKQPLTFTDDELKHFLRVKQPIADDEDRADMVQFYRMSMKNYAASKTVFATPKRVLIAIDAYLEACELYRIVPTLRSFAIFLHLPSIQYYINLSDERGDILRTFRDFVNENLNQQGLNGKKNATFTMYYLKSMAKQYDQPDKTQIEINVGQNVPFALNDPTGGFGAIDAEWTDVEPAETE